MTAANGTPALIEVVRVEPNLIAMVRKTVPLSDLPRAQRDARSLLDTALQEAGIVSVGRTLTVWRPPQAGTMDYAPGVFVPDAFGVSGPVSLFTLPHGRAAHLRMTGPFAGLPDAWRRLFSESEARGLVPAGLNWEVYGAPEEGGADLYALLA